MSNRTILYVSVCPLYSTCQICMECGKILSTILLSTLSHEIKFNLKEDYIHVKMKSFMYFKMFHAFYSYLEISGAAVPLLKGAIDSVTQILSLKFYLLN